MAEVVPPSPDAPADWLGSMQDEFEILGDLAAWVARATARLREAPLTHEIALAARRLPLPHPDPADRFLVATAQVLNLTLVTADAALLGLGEIATLGNR